MLFVILTGLGVLWDEDGLSQIIGGNCTYNGVHANQAYQNISGCPQVPLEQEEAVGNNTACKQ